MTTFLKVPRKVHNALLIVTSLAEREGGALVSLAEIAAKERVSRGFLEEIASALRANGLIEGRRGAGGGYALTRPADTITVGDVISAVEGPLALPKHGVDDRLAGALSARCASWTVWNAVHRKVADALEGMTLADVAAARKRPLRA